MKLVIASDEGAQFFDELFGSIPDLEVVIAASPAEAKAHVADADVYYGRPWNELVDEAPNLKLIQAQSAGVDFVLSMPALQASAVPLANTRGAHAPSIAEHTFALLLALTRGFPTCSAWQQKRYWARGEGYRMPREIMGGTIGIVGYGAIGRAIAQRAVGFDMKVVAVDLFPVMDAPYVDEVWPVERFHDLLGASDVVAIAVPFTNETRRMFDAAAFAAMKPGSYIVAISRGGIIDEEALVAALQSGQLAGAGLDVAEVEPLPDSSPLWDAPNVILTPHLAGSSAQKERRCAEVLRENILRLQRGDELTNLVNKELGF